LYSSLHWGAVCSLYLSPPCQVQPHSRACSAVQCSAVQGLHPAAPVTLVASRHCVFPAAGLLLLPSVILPGRPAPPGWKAVNPGSTVINSTRLIGLGNNGKVMDAFVGFDELDATHPGHWPGHRPPSPHFSDWLLVPTAAARGATATSQLVMAACRKLNLQSGPNFKNIFNFDCRCRAMHFSNWDTIC
jgi:hypothetical protein